MTPGTCPGCGSIVPHADLERIAINDPPKTWKGVSYLCPNCRTVLGIGIDPLALKEDTVRAVARQVRKD